MGCGRQALVTAAWVTLLPLLWGSLLRSSQVEIPNGNLDFSSAVTSRVIDDSVSWLSLLNTSMVQALS